MDIVKEFESLESNKYSFDIKTIEYIKTFPKVFIWGCTESAGIAYELLEENNIEVTAFFGKYEAKEGATFKGLPILNPDYKDVDMEAAIIITNSFFHKIREELLKYDENIDNRLFLFDGYFLENITYDYYNENREKINRCYDLLSDQKSKDLYLSLLKYRYLRDSNLLKTNYDDKNDTYFDSVTVDKFADGIIIDAGSYDGEFVIEFAKRKDVSNCEFYVFEPNKEHVKLIKEKLENKYNVKVFGIALCDKKGSIQFSSIEASTSHIVSAEYNVYHNSEDKQIEEVPCDYIDNIVGNEKVSVIKMDVEGADYSVLEGAKETIIKNRPLLLLSAYHRCSDLWELLNFIADLDLDYSFYMRHYSCIVAETILYCVPN